MLSKATYTHIVVGAGTAGCLLAARLAERDPSNRVLLIEGGGSDRGRLRYRIPSGYLACIGNPKADWMYSTESEPGLNGRSLKYPRGKTLGGCSSINGMLFLRGQRDDYDYWAATTADAKWAWSNVLSLSKRHERHWKGSSAFHGDTGELHVQKQRLSWPILDDIQGGASRALSLPVVDDFNTGDNRGVGYFEVTQRHGRRWNSADAFLFKPPTPSREGEWAVTSYLKENWWTMTNGASTVHKNLTVAPHVTVDRVLFEGDRCVGVQCVGYLSGEGHEFRLDSHEAATVVLSAGAVSSPCILMRSGIGPATTLARHDIKPIVQNNAIGSNLADHLQIRTVFKLHGGGAYTTLNSRTWSPMHAIGMAADYAMHSSGPLAMAPSQLGAFACSSSSETRPNVEFHIQPLSLDAFGEPLHRFDAVTVSVCNLRPTSRGSVTITSKDATAPPSIRPNYLSDDYDRMVAADSIELARRVMADPAVADKYKPEEIKPGPDCTSRGALVKAAGNISSTIFHPSCTVRMGRDDDASAPLTSRLEVKGVRRLRVCDASVMPTITSGNTNEPVNIIAERLADILCPPRCA